jgi:hypothetical protein
MLWGSWVEACGSGCVGRVVSPEIFSGTGIARTNLGDLPQTSADVLYTHTHIYIISMLYQYTYETLAVR